MFSGVQNETKRLILEAARDVFARKGYHRALVSEIAAEAGFGKGTIYRHFDNKAGLFASLVENIFSGMALRVGEAVKQREGLSDKLELIFDEHLKLFRENRELVEIIVNEGIELTGIREHGMIEKWNRYLNLVREIFARGIETGEFIAVSEETATWLFLSSIWGLLRNAVLFELPDLEAEYKEPFLRILREGGFRGNQ